METLAVDERRALRLATAPPLPLLCATSLRHAPQLRDQYSDDWRLLTLATRARARRASMIRLVQVLTRRARRKIRARERQAATSSDNNCETWRSPLQRSPPRTKIGNCSPPRARAFSRRQRRTRVCGARRIDKQTGQQAAKIRRRLICWRVRARRRRAAGAGACA